MKIKNVLLIATILIITGLSSDLMAQNALRAMVKKCESADNVEVNVVRKKDKETMKLKQSITTIRIKSNKALIDEFIAAFEKDEPSAYEVIYTKKDGKIVPQYFKFKDVSFSFSTRTSNSVWLSGSGFVMNGEGGKNTISYSYSDSKDNKDSKDKKVEKKTEKEEEIVSITMIEEN